MCYEHWYMVLGYSYIATIATVSWATIWRCGIWTNFCMFIMKSLPLWCFSVSVLWWQKMLHQKLSSLVFSFKDATCTCSQATLQINNISASNYHDEITASITLLMVWMLKIYLIFDSSYTFMITMKSVILY